MSDPLEALGSMVLYLGLICGALLLVRRWATKVRGRGQGTPAGIRIVTRAGMARGVMLAVVEVDGRRFLVGAGEQGVSLLSDLGVEDSVGQPTSTSTADILTTPTIATATSSALPDDLASVLTPATERLASTPDGPRIGLADRLRAMTVRTHVERPIRAPGS